MEKTSRDLADLLDSNFKLATLFNTPFEVSEGGIEKYYAHMNPKRTHYQDHKPEGMLFLAYMLHNPPNVPRDTLDIFFKYALAFYRDESINGLKQGLGQLSHENRVQLSTYIAEKFAHFNKFSGPDPTNVTKDDQGFRHHLSHALNPFPLALWKHIYS
jgi:hypothetical protein